MNLSSFPIIACFLPQRPHLRELVPILYPIGNRTIRRESGYSRFQTRSCLLEMQTSIYTVHSHFRITGTLPMIAQDRKMEKEMQARGKRSLNFQ